jgi:mannan endo-1,4-beta-mannosidase
MQQTGKRIITIMILVAVLCCTFLYGSAASAEETAVLHLEAEDGTFFGNVKANQSSGTGWVEGFRSAGDSFQLLLSVEKDGSYDISVILASMDGSHKENPLILDGSSIGKVITESKSFGRNTLKYVYLTAGDHTLGMDTEWGWIKVDAIEVAPSAPLPEDLYQIEPVLCNPDPSPEAQRLFNWLCECYGKKVITGQFCDGGMYGMENQAIWRATGGSYPAILGLDMMEYSPSRVAYGASGNAVKLAIDYWEKGGLVTFCWHWNAPEPYLQSDRWYSGFYTQYTSFNLAKALDGRDSAGYDLLIRDIDAIAEELKVLRDAGVPVLWRPLHEASGGWFWWGASGADAYKQLWNLLYDRLCNLHGLNNLIWIWNGQNAEWYPGDDTVDIIGEDIYPGERVYSSQSAKFIECLDYTDARKMIILSENGCVPDAELLFRDGTVWGSFCTWGGEFVLKNSKFNAPSEQYTEIWLLKKVYADERVITRADIPDLKGNGI